MVRAGRTRVAGSVGHRVASFGAVVRAWPALLVRVMMAGVSSSSTALAKVRRSSVTPIVPRIRVLTDRERTRQRP